MGNCLVTKLKSVVDNDNLKKIDEVIIDVSPSSRNAVVWIASAGGEQVTIKALTGYFMLSQDGSPVTEHATTGTNIYLSGEPAKISICSKYKIASLSGYAGYNIANINLDDWAFVGGTRIELQGSFASPRLRLPKCMYFGLTETAAGVLNFTLKELSDRLAESPTITQFLYQNYIDDCQVHGDLSEISPEVAGRLTRFYFVSNTVTGDLASLGSFVNCTEFDFNRSSLTGSIESFVEAQITAGRTEVLASAPVYFNQITRYPFYGHIYQRTSENLIEWNSDASRIIVYTDGHGRNVDNFARIYAHGASAQEIAAWQAAGKTVTDVDTDTVYNPTN